MEWTIHLGTAKTGTTAIQHGLDANRRILLKHGIFYPKIGGKAHHALNAIFRPAERVAPSILHRAGNDERRMRAMAEKGWQRIRQQIDHYRPAKVILSSENFFLGPAGDMEQFRDRLVEVSPNIRLCLYVRSPAPFYLSGLNQQAKSRSSIRLPHPLQVRETIQAIEAAFGQRIEIRAFDPARLHESDSLADFLAHMIDAPLEVRQLRGERVNETVSAEAMDILVRNRRVNLPDMDRVPTETQTLLIETLRALDLASGRKIKPRLHPDVTTAIVRASTELLWLRDRYGVVFSDVDYATIDGTMPEDVAGRTRIDELCAVDEAWREELLFRAMHQMLEAGSAIGTLKRIVPVQGMVRAYVGTDRLVQRTRRGMLAAKLRLVSRPPAAK